MVSLHVIPNRSFLNFALEKKLSIALKTLLVLEATAKVALIVSATLIDKGTPLRPRSLIYQRIHCYLQPLWVVSLRTTHCADKLVTCLPSYIPRIGMTFKVTVSKHERLTVPQVYFTRIWRPGSNTRSVQGARVMEDEWILWFAACPCPYQGSGPLLFHVCLS